MLNVDWITAGGITPELAGGGPSSRSRGPFAFLRLEADTLAGPGGEFVARLKAAGWRGEGETTAELRITPLVELQFETGERRSAGHGPFTEVRLVGSAVEAGGKRLAEIRDGQLVEEHGQSWTALMITPSTSAHG